MFGSHYADRVLSTADVCWLLHWRVAQEKLQAQKKKQDERNAKAAAKRAAKNDKAAAKASGRGKGQGGDAVGAVAAGGVATFDVEDAPVRSHSQHP